MVSDAALCFADANLSRSLPAAIGRSSGWPLFLYLRPSSNNAMFDRFETRNTAFRLQVFIRVEARNDTRHGRLRAEDLVAWVGTEQQVNSTAKICPSAALQNVSGNVSTAQNRSLNTATYNFLRATSSIIGVFAFEMSENISLPRSADGW